MKMLIKNYRVISLTCLSTLLFTANVSAARIDGDAAAGKEKAAVCAGCHNPDGNSPVGMNPVIAGQHADYLYNTLQAYQSGARKNAIMNGIAAGLTDEDMRNLAVYFSKQNSKLNTVPADKLD